MKKILFFVFTVVAISNLCSENKKYGIEFGLTYSQLQNTSEWNFPSTYDMNNYLLSDYDRYNDNISILGYKIGLSYKASSFLSLMFTFGFGYTNLDNGNIILIHDKGTNGNVEYKQKLFSVEPEIGAKIKILDISFLGSNRKDLGIGIEGRLGIEWLSIKSYDFKILSSDISGNYSETAQGEYVNASYGINILISEILGMSIGNTCSVVLSAFPKENDIYNNYPYVVFEYFL